jgi:hypothetical protein
MLAGCNHGCTCADSPLPGCSHVRAHAVAELRALPWVRVRRLAAAWLQPCARPRCRRAARAAMGARAQTRRCLFAAKCNALAQPKVTQVSTGDNVISRDLALLDSQLKRKGSRPLAQLLRLLPVTCIPLLQPNNSQSPSSAALQERPQANAPTTTLYSGLHPSTTQRACVAHTPCA